MKAQIKAVTAGKFNEDQERILKRVALVLIEHGFSVEIVKKVKVQKSVKLKIVL